MMSEQYLIDIIKEYTPYTNVKLADDTIDMTALLSNAVPVGQPIITVGHLGIRNQHPEDLWANAWHELRDNEEILVTSIRFLARRKELHSVRAAIKDAYVAKSPFPNDSNYSSLVFLSAAVIAKTGDNIYWEEKIGLAMPRVG